MTLSNALNFFSKSKKIKVIVSLTEEKYTQIFLNNLTENVNVQKVENLHAKLIVTDNFVYLGSANITKTGTSINKEICKLEKNTSESAERFLKKLGYILFNFFLSTFFLLAVYRYYVLHVELYALWKVDLYNSFSFYSMKSHPYI
jgi:hypothetical protein